MICNFLEQFKKLKKSSVDAVVDGNNKEIDELKKYLHIVRNIELSLINIIERANYSNKKTLVLICGSVGDGKSHLLSILKNSESQLIENYQIYNDATESFEPNKSCIETLNNILSDFSDKNLDNQSSKKLIIAINLGTLNNFLESEFALEYTEFKKFIINRNILNGELNMADYIDNSNFQSINFGDFKSYTLTEDGVKVDFIINILDKITAFEDNNIFCEEYLNGEDCSRMKNCPVRHNYELLQNENVQKNIALKLVEMSIKEKYFLSTREILDFIYSIVVHHDFEKLELFDITDNNIFLEKYIEYSLPSLMFDQLEENSYLLSKFDYLKTRFEHIDQEIIGFNVSTNIYNIYEPIIKETSYKNIMNKDNLDNLSNLNNNKGDIKTKIFKFILRTKHLMTENQIDIQDIKYEQFLKYLYWFNSGNISELKNLYDMVWISILRWNGYINDNWIRISKQKNVSLFAKLELEPTPRSFFSNNKELERFENNIIVGFMKKNSAKENKNIKFLNIDYSLYKLIFKINSGYLPTAQDKQVYIEFGAFISSLYELSNANEEICIINSENKKAIFKNDKSFGYEFEVM